jgi:hypothetical protein
MNNTDILSALGLSLGANKNYSDRWVKATIQDVPPSMREWALDHLADMMRSTQQPCGVWRVREV